MTKLTKDKNFKWVYPLNKHISDFNQTFVYGYSNPKAKLYVEVVNAINNRNIGSLAHRHKIKIFPNGNFAQVIKLPFKKNVIRMTRVFNGKEKIITRNVIARSVTTKQSPNRDALIDCHASFHSARNDVLRVCIDAGHGGKEHGTHSPKGVPEKVFNLGISKMLMRALVRALPTEGEVRPKGRHATPQRVKTYLTRETDKYVSLDDRIRFAKKKKCNLFISIHHNALPDNENPLKHRGVGVYYTHDSVKPIAKKFLESICKETKLKRYGLFKRNFRVTKQDFYNGILIECGFLTHPLESEIVVTKVMQRKIVKGITRALSNGF